MMNRKISWMWVNTVTVTCTGFMERISDVVLVVSDLHFNMELKFVRGVKVKMGKEAINDLFRLVDEHISHALDSDSATSKLNSLN